MSEIAEVELTHQGTAPSAENPWRCESDIAKGGRRGAIPEVAGGTPRKPRRHRQPPETIRLRQSSESRRRWTGKASATSEQMDASIGSGCS